MTRLAPLLNNRTLILSLDGVSVVLELLRHNAQVCLFFRLSVFASNDLIVSAVFPFCLFRYKQNVLNV